MTQFYSKTAGLSRGKQRGEKQYKRCVSVKGRWDLMSSGFVSLEAQLRSFSIPSQLRKFGPRFVKLTLKPLATALPSTCSRRQANGSSFSDRATYYMWIGKALTSFVNFKLINTSWIETYPK